MAQPMFRILSQRQTSDLSRDGRFIDVMEVTVLIPSIDVTFTEMVPVTEYNAVTVQARILDRVEEILRVHTLGQFAPPAEEQG